MIKQFIETHILRTVSCRLVWNQKSNYGFQLLARASGDVTSHLKNLIPIRLKLRILIKRRM